ncbi:MAG: hypothetical protein ACLS43_08455 [Evtepia gabavorous]
MRFSKQNHSRIPMPGKPGTCRLQVRDLGVTLGRASCGYHLQLNCRKSWP